MGDRIRERLVQELSAAMCMSQDEVLALGVQVDNDIFACEETYWGSVDKPNGWLRRLLGLPKKRFAVKIVIPDQQLTG